MELVAICKVEATTSKTWAKLHVEQKRTGIHESEEDNLIKKNFRVPSIRQSYFCLVSSSKNDSSQNTIENSICTCWLGFECHTFACILLSSNFSSTKFLVHDKINDVS